jgi:hypothetical protein
VVLTVASAAAAPGQTRLVISGAFHTTNARAVSNQEEGCGFRTIPHFRGRRHYDARAPAPYGRTAVQVVTARNAATGVGSGFYIARSGTVAVSQAKNVGRLGRSGSVSGTVHGRLRLQRGTERLRLDGSWHCRLDAGANGG